MPVSSRLPTIFGNHLQVRGRAELVDELGGLGITVVDPERCRRTTGEDTVSQPLASTRPALAAARPGRSWVHGGVLLGVSRAAASWPGGRGGLGGAAGWRRGGAGRQPGRPGATPHDGEDTVSQPHSRKQSRRHQHDERGNGWSWSLQRSGWFRRSFRGADRPRPTWAPRPDGLGLLAQHGQLLPGLAIADLAPSLSSQRKR